MVILKDNMRHSEDEECLKRIRRGIFLPKDVAIVNARVLTPLHYSKLQLCLNGRRSVPMVDRGNDLQ